MPPPGGPGPFSLAEPDRIRSVLGAAGFRDVVVSPGNDLLSFPASDLARLVARTTAHGGVRGALLGADDTTRSKVQAAIEDAVATYVDGGRVRLSRGVHVIVAST